VTCVSVGVGRKMNERSIECFFMFRHQNVDIMCVQSCVVTPSFYHYCRVHVTIPSPFIVIGVNVAVNNREFTITMTMHCYPATNHSLLLFKTSMIVCVSCLS